MIRPTRHVSELLTKKTTYLVPCLQTPPKRLAFSFLTLCWTLHMFGKGLKLDCNEVASEGRINIQFVKRMDFYWRVH